MEYKFTPERENYEMYASGGILYASPGHTAFPVRLASEIFRRCAAYRASWGAAGRCTVYDPCCGSAYHLTTIAYLNWNGIEQIRASDVGETALSTAQRNLSLLSLSGLEKRIEQLTSMLQQFGKSSHETALKNALILKQQLSAYTADHAITTHVFRADVMDSAGIQAAWGDAKVDLVFTDIPYGQRSSWQLDTPHPPAEDAVEPVQHLLEALRPILDSKAVVAIAAAKKDKVKHPAYHRLEKFTVGKRQIVILRPL